MMCYNAIRSTITMFPKKSDVFDQIFVHFPDNTWPKCFLDYIEEAEADSKPTASWTSDYKKVFPGTGTEDLKKAHLGYKIHERFVFCLHHIEILYVFY